jgi:predicted translin family RNA/ssDNA-binding protein
MLSGYNNNRIPTSSQVIENMPYYNSLNTNYPTNLELDIKNKLNQKRNELNRLINDLRYAKSYNYKEI